MVDQPKTLVGETSTTTGTGNVTVTQAAGRQRLSDAFGTGGGPDKFTYYISHQTANNEWEEGTGTMLDANTLVRDTVIASSNAGSLVNFSAGTKDVTNDIQSTRAVETDTTQTLTNKTIDDDNNTLSNIATSALKSLTGNAANVVTAAAAGSNGAVVLWDANGNLIDISLTGDGDILIGDGADSPKTLTAFTSSTGNLLPAKGGTIGQQTFNLPAASWLPEDGAAGPELATFTGTNIDESELLFDGASTETAFFTIQMPKGSDETAALVFEVAYAPKGTSSGNVRWSIAAGARGAGDSRDVTLGTAAADNSAAGATANTERRSGEITVTPGGTWAAEDNIVIRLQRIGGDAGDTNTDDCGMITVRGHYTLAAGTDD